MREIQDMPLGVAELAAPLRRSAGVTLVELMVAMAVITIGVVGSMGTFRYIAASIRLSRIRTIAQNLAQEEVESLKNTPYAMLLVTTNTISDNNFDPPIVYDASNYPPSTISMWGGVPLTRAVYVSYAAPFGNDISTVSYTSTDPGLKLIRVYVLWNQDGQWRNFSLTNLLENPNVSALDATLSGRVFLDAPGTPPLPGAQVEVLGSSNWQALTDSNGNYSFNVAHGSYTVIASSTSHYTQESPLLSVPAGLTTTQDFTLTATGTGTVSSYGVYVDSDLLVSQVVADTHTLAGDGDIHDVEYVELFNPTTHSILLDDGSGLPPVQLNFLPEGGAGAGTTIPLVHVSSIVPAGSYYLISNATSFFALGRWNSADARYANLYSNVIWNGTGPSAGAVRLLDSAGNIIDGVGWSHTGSGKQAPWSEGGPVPQSGGLQAGDQIVRMSSACLSDPDYGRAYDSDDNANNFTYNPNSSAGFFTIPPGNTATAAPVVSGVPARGGWVSVDDGLSAAAPLTIRYSATAAPYNQSCPYSSFQLNGVATGTWTAIVSSGTYSQAIAGVVVTQGSTTPILNAATSPADATGFNYLPVSSQTADGYLSGTIRDGNGAPLSGIVLADGAAQTVSGATGLYFMAVSSGASTIAVNPNQKNPLYVSLSAPVSVQTGRVTAHDSTLSQGGTLAGYIANPDLSALPGIVVAATNAGSGTTGSAVADGTGHFYIQNLSTGTYAVAPVVDATQSASPASISASLASGGDSVFVGTFTVSGGMATISGAISAAGQAITTGVLVIASTEAISDPPPAVDAANSAAGVPYYAASSRTDGTYSLQVRGSTTAAYNIRAFYPIVNVITGATNYTSKYAGGVSVWPGATLSGQNFTWP